MDNPRLSLPKPYGRFTPGRTQLDYSYTAKSGKSRELSALIFYPADSDEGRKSAPWGFAGLIELINPVLGNIMPPKLVIETASYADVALSCAQSNWPVLIFNHGGGGNMHQNTTLCQDLASEGYIVVSIGHVGDCVMQYTDGRIVPISAEYLTQMAGATEEHLPMLGKVLMPLSDSEALEAERIFYTAEKTALFGEELHVWGEDISATVDWLGRLNAGQPDSMFKGRLRLSIGVGSLGHSFGGAASGRACAVDGRVMCGINMDGAAFGTQGCDYGKPFLTICTQLVRNLNRSVFLNNSADSYCLLETGVGHLAFSDVWFLPVEMYPNDMPPEMNLGTRDRAEHRDICTRSVKCFFDYYLLHTGAPLCELALPDVEILFRPAEKI